jgi:hypothetical protein
MQTAVPAMMKAQTIQVLSGVMSEFMRWRDANEH